MERLEKRKMFAIWSLRVTAGALQMWTDNNATSVAVSRSEPTIGSAKPARVAGVSHKNGGYA
jgi:hypothetical protein